MGEERTTSSQRALDSLVTSAERRNRQASAKKQQSDAISSSPNQSQPMNALAPTFSPATTGGDEEPSARSGGAQTSASAKGFQGGAFASFGDSTAAHGVGTKSQKMAERDAERPSASGTQKTGTLASRYAINEPATSTVAERTAPTGKKSDSSTTSSRPSRHHVAHRKTPSEMTPLIAEQFALQQQIELLQQQQVLLQTQQAAIAAMPVGGQSPLGAAGTRNTRVASGAPNAHRRIGSLTTGIESLQIQAGDGPRTLPKSSEDPSSLQQLASAGDKERHRTRTASAALDLNNGKTSTRRHSNIPEDAAIQGDPSAFEFPPRTRNATGSTRSQLNSMSTAEGKSVSTGSASRHRSSHSRGGSRNFDGDWRTSAGPQAVQPNFEELQMQAQQQAQMHQMQTLQDHVRALSFAGAPNSDPAALMNASNTAALLQAQAQLQAQMLGIGLPSYPLAMQAGMVPSISNSALYNLNAAGQGQQGQQRKTLFAPYLPQESIPELLAQKKLVQGSLRINKKNRSDAYVSTDQLDGDIFICGSKDRNRALEGDIVAVELLDVEEVWTAKREKEEKKRRKEDYSTSQARPLGVRPTSKKRDESEAEPVLAGVAEEEDVSDDMIPKYAGHVVAVVERVPGQMYSGQLGLLRPSSAATKEKQDAERREKNGPDAVQTSQQAERPKIIWFKPTDKRVPLIAIPTEQAPEDFVDNQEKYASILFVACIKRWPITSLHPFGNLVEEVGQIGDVDAETKAILKDNGFTDDPHDESVIKCLPPVPWSIPAREYIVRRDVRGERVFSIDPPTARDLDDAIHIKTLDNGLFEVGVHIADVSYFVKLNTALDREARKRATTVYLIQKAIPMLPELLCQELCSLNPAVERLTFSVIWKMDREAQVVDEPWFGRTIIKSRAKLAYGHAQSVIEGKPLDPDVQVVDATHEELERDIRAFNRLAGILRMRRFDGGALKMDSIKLSFNMDDEGEPIDCQVYHQRDANKLIEEFMLLANIAVAQKISKSWPEEAFLRRHERPIQNRMDAFKKRAKQLGYEFDIESSRGMAESFAQVDNQSAADILKLLAIRPMHPAKYFCAGTVVPEEWLHYALAVPMYTHFTSPIRRYADVVVHRQLEAALASDPQTPMDADTVIKVAVNCNSRKEASRIAQEQSAHLFLCIMIHNLTIRFGPVIRPAIVFGILDAAFDIYIPDFGIEKRIHMNHLPVENSIHDAHENSLKIYWKKGSDVVEYLATTKNDEQAKLLRENAKSNKEALIVKAPNRAAKYVPELDEDEAAAIEEADLHVTKATAKQYAKSKSGKLVSSHFSPGQLSDENGHAIQILREMTVVPVVITSDLSKSPALIRVFGVNPYAAA